MTLSSREIRVLLVADDPLARAGLGALLAGQPGILVVAQLAGEDAAPGDLVMHRPDIIVWDAGWGQDPVGERLSDLKESRVPVAVLVPDQSRASEAWAAGANAILQRDARPAALLAAIYALLAGLLVVAPGLGAVTPRRNGGIQPALPDPLTARELEVLRLLAEGLPNKLISSRLTISEHTVKFHINAILGKLGAQSRTEAVTLAIRVGLVQF